MTFFGFCIELKSGSRMNSVASQNSEIDIFYFIYRYTIHVLGSVHTLSNFTFIYSESVQQLYCMNFRKSLETFKLV